MKMCCGFSIMQNKEENMRTKSEYAVRSATFGKNNNVPMFSNDVLYGKVGMFGHLIHVNELELG